MGEPLASPCETKPILARPSVWVNEHGRVTVEPIALRTRIGRLSLFYPSQKNNLVDENAPSA